MVVERECVYLNTTTVDQNGLSWVRITVFFRPGWDCTIISEIQDDSVIILILHSQDPDIVIISWFYTCLFIYRIPNDIWDEKINNSWKILTKNIVEMEKSHEK
jgi:hypothetical protein